MIYLFLKYLDGSTTQVVPKQGALNMFLSLCAQQLGTDRLPQSSVHITHISVNVNLSYTPVFELWEHTDSNWEI